MRLDDHPAAHAAAAAAASSSGGGRLLPVVALDWSRALKTTGPHRLRFQLECLRDLAERLEASGSGLVVRPGPAEQVLPEVLAEAAVPPLSTASSTDALLFFHRAVPVPPLGDEQDDDEEEQGQLERKAAAAFFAAAQRLGYRRAGVRRLWGEATLHHPWLETRAWLLPPGGSGGAPEVAEADDDDDEQDQAMRSFLLEHLPPSFSAYKRALEAEAPTTTTRAKTNAKTERKSAPPPLSRTLPFRAPLPPPKAPLPPLPEGVSCPFPPPQLLGDVRDAYEDQGALASLLELERLVSGNDGLFARGSVLPAYACGGPQIADGGWRHPLANPRSAFPWVGGESAGRARLEHVLGRVVAVAQRRGRQRDEDEAADDGDRHQEAAADLPYGEARMMAAGAWSAGLSPYLSAGCLTPRRVAAELLLLARRRRGAVAAEAGAQGEDDDNDDIDDGVLWLLTHLVIRDWYVLSGWRDKLRVDADAAERRRSGTQEADEDAKAATAAPFEAWAAGRTGLSPFVDASMRELAATGWQSNRSRQNCASLLVHELLRASTRGDGSSDADPNRWPAGWRRGARLYESLLIDADPSANRGNWRSVLGRCFDTAAQAEKYDPEGRLARAWLDE